MPIQYHILWSLGCQINQISLEFNYDQDKMSVLLVDTRQNQMRYATRYRITMNLVGEFNELGTELQWTWYRITMNLVENYSELGTGLQWNWWGITVKVFIDHVHTFGGLIPWHPTPRQRSQWIMPTNNIVTMPLGMGVHHEPWYWVLAPNTRELRSAISWHRWMDNSALKGNLSILLLLYLHSYHSSDMEHEKCRCSTL